MAELGPTASAATAADPAFLIAGDGYFSSRAIGPLQSAGPRSPTQTGSGVERQPYLGQDRPILRKIAVDLFTGDVVPEHARTSF